MYRTFRRVSVWVAGIIGVGVILVLAFFMIPPLRGPMGKVSDRNRGVLREVQAMKVLWLRGAPYEMGYEYGRLLKTEIQGLLGGFEAQLDRMAREDMGLNPWLARRVLDTVYRCSGPFVPQRYRRELEGLADGSGVSLQALRRIHVLSVITERNCSSFAVFGQATQDGKVYHSRNFDWSMDLGLQDHPILVVYQGEGLNPFVNIGYVGLIGCLTGMNVQGLSVGHIGAVSQDTSLFGTPMPFLVRRILEETSDLEKAVRILQVGPRTVGDNYVIADGKAGAGVAVETCRHLAPVFTDNDPKEANVEYAIRIEDAVFRADEAMDPDVRRRQRCANGYPNLPYGSNSYDHRYKGMADRIQRDYGQIDSEVAIQIVRDTAMRGTNLHWALYAPSDLDFWVAHAKGSEDAWMQPCQKFNLRELLALGQEEPAQ